MHGLDNESFADAVGCVETVECEKKCFHLSSRFYTFADIF